MFRNLTEECTPSSHSARKPFQATFEAHRASRHIVLFHYYPTHTLASRYINQSSRRTVFVFLQLTFASRYISHLVVPFSSSTPTSIFASRIIRYLVVSFSSIDYHLDFMMIVHPVLCTRMLFVFHDRLHILYEYTQSRGGCRPSNILVHVIITRNCTIY